jgi:hypothetical protein
MKKVIVVMLALAVFAAQGLAFAEDVVVDVQATAEPAVAATPDTATPVPEDAVPAEDIVMPEDDEMVLVEETGEAVPAAEKAAM